MSYKIVEYSADLDLSSFYKDAETRGFENNQSQKAMFDCFHTEREWWGWMLSYNGEYIGGVCAHSFDEVMGPDSYRILARTCVFNDKTHRPYVYTRNTCIVQQQNAAAQFYVSVILQKIGLNKKFYATSNSNNTGSQQVVNRLWFPEQAKLGRFNFVKREFYRGCEQNIWQLNVKEWQESIAVNEQWPCEFPNGDPRK